MYEQGVIRPPSEASSLLLRVTRNCPWNQCLFCPAYKGTTFSKRSTLRTIPKTREPPPYFLTWNMDRGNSKRSITAWFTPPRFTRMIA